MVIKKLTKSNCIIFNLMFDQIFNDDIYFPKKLFFQNVYYNISQIMIIYDMLNLYDQ